MTVALCAVFASVAMAEIPDKLNITLDNKTDSKVFVALAGMSTGGEDEWDYSKGWWGVEPGKTRTVTIDYGPVYEYGYYAFAKDSKQVWEGSVEKENNLGMFWIHPSESFNTHPNNPIKGGKKVCFRHIPVGDDGNITLTFTGSAKAAAKAPAKGSAKSSASKLSDAEYLKMKKNSPAFAEADNELTKAWNEAKKVLGKNEFNKLKKEQQAWIAGGRDKRANALIKDGVARDEAYATATEERTEEIRGKLKSSKPAKGRSSKEAKLLARTKGTWRVDGDTNTAYLVMDGKGNFKAYYASGALEMSGTLSPEEEYEDVYCYVLHDKSGKNLEMAFFIDDNGTELHFGNGDGPVYIKDED